MEFGLFSIIGAHAQLEIEEGKIRVDKDGFAEKGKRNVLSGFLKRDRKAKKEYNVK